MKSGIFHCSQSHSFETEERCSITEIANDNDDAEVSIAHVSVAAKVSTQWHELIETDERYIITQGYGLMEVEGVVATEVKTGDVVRIARNTAQRITNIGQEDLLLTCICTPRFHIDCYKARYDLEAAS